MRRLSGGNQQKVVLARAMSVGARVFMLDEPTRGVDVGAKVEVYNLIGDLAAKGAAVLIVSSDLLELLGLCDRIGVMRAGWFAGEVDRRTSPRTASCRSRRSDRRMSTDDTSSPG